MSTNGDRYSLKMPLITIAGAPKCGTSSLHEFLAMHDDICAPVVKETGHFLTRDSGLQGAQYLRTYFPHFDGHQYIMDSTPWYLYSRRAPQEILTACSDALVIILVRDPAERAVSHYIDQVVAGSEDRLLSEAVQQDVQRSNRGPWIEVPRDCYVLGSEYDRFISYWVQLFGKDRVFVASLEDLQKHGSADLVRERLFDFLCLVDHGRQGFPHQNARARSGVPVMLRWLNDPPKVVGKLTSALRSVPWAHRTYRRLAEKVRGWLLRQGDPEIPLDLEPEDLRRHFGSDREE